MFSILGHLITTAFKAFWRLLITVVVFAALGAGAVLLVLYHYTQRVPWPLQHQNQMTLVLWHSWARRPCLATLAG